MEYTLKTHPFARRAAGQVSGRMLGGLVVVVVLILAALYLLWPKLEQESLPSPEATETTSAAPLETVAPAQSEEERGDSAREIIASVRADPGGADYAQAYQGAQAFQASGRAADAQLLLFFAARGGYPPAAFDLATMYDPIHFSASTSLMNEPDASQAYKWYRSARDAGESEAVDRLNALRAWAEAAGTPEAERLLLKWEQTP